MRKLELDAATNWNRKGGKNTFKSIFLHQYFPVSWILVKTYFSYQMLLFTLLHHFSLINHLPQTLQPTTSCNGYSCNMADVAWRKNMFIQNSEKMAESVSYQAFISTAGALRVGSLEDFRPFYQPSTYGFWAFKPVYTKVFRPVSGSMWHSVER